MATTYQPETFLQRQARLGNVSRPASTQTSTAGTSTQKAPTQVQQTQNPGTQANHQTVTGSPVNSSGYPSGQTTQLSKPQSTTPPAPTQPAPQGSDPFAAQGGGVWTGTGWLPKSHPAAIAHLAGPQNTAGAAPNPAPMSPYGPYPGRSQDTQLQAMNLGNTPFATYGATQVDPNFNAPQSYQGTQFSQFQGPDQAAMNAQQTQLMSGILSDPHSMSAQNVAQLKERQKESALRMAQQLGQQAGSAAAARGFQGNGSLMGGAQRAIDQNMLAEILGGNRDIDLQKMQQDRADELQALQASEALQQGQLGRGMDAYRTTLLGQTTQADDTRGVTQDALASQLAQFDARMKGAQFNADENFRAYESGASAEDRSLQRALAQFGINAGVNESNQANYQSDVDAFFRNRDAEQAKANLAVQQQLGQGGLNLDAKKLAEQRRQFNLGHALDRLQFGEGARQFNSDLGFRYNQLDTNSTNQMLDRILPR